MLLSQPKVPMFKNEPTAFGTFMSFDARIVPNTSGDTYVTVLYLDQQLEGEFKDLIAGYLNMISDDGYQNLLITACISTVYVN